MDKNNIIELGNNKYIDLENSEVTISKQLYMQDIEIKGYKNEIAIKILDDIKYSIDVLNWNDYINKEEIINCKEKLFIQTKETLEQVLGKL